MSTIAVMGNTALRRVAPGAVAGPTRRRSVQTALLYAGLLTLNIGFLLASSHPGVHALALGLTVPGGGFLVWATPIGVSLFAASSVLFVVALGLWFATGNVLLPAIVWLGAAVVAGVTGGFWIGDYTASTLLVLLPAAMLAALAITTTLTMLLGYRRREWYARFVAGTGVQQIAHAVSALPSPARDEIAFDDLRRMRLLLDRALQPIDRFDGFEWLDQFQTAAVRYQINFMSYALSVASYAYLPAFAGYMATAQRNLVAKQLDHRVWRYWAFESLWGNLSSSRDPIARDNIMYSGFLAAQIAFARGSVGICDYDAPDTLKFLHPAGTQIRYSVPDIVRCLARQYESAPYGLLACEPNWIYPLCNIITASGMRGIDAQLGTRHWDVIEDAFCHHLKADFTATGGRLMAFRSSLTGLGTSAVGGAILQSLPCLFLNAVRPDLASQQWQRVRHDLAGPRQRRFLWPIDVGNYGFSRASSYAATAAAAVELGDGEVANELLGRLEAECPSNIADGVIHRSRTSLWSHAAELIARLGRQNALHSLVNKPHPIAKTGPYIKSAVYPEVLVAAARSDRGTLRAVIYPGTGEGYKRLTIAGLRASTTYLVDTFTDQRLTSDSFGEAELCVPVSGRTALHIYPST